MNIHYHHFYLSQIIKRKRIDSHWLFSLCNTTRTSSQGYENIFPSTFEKMPPSLLIVSASPHSYSFDIPTPPIHRSRVVVLYFLFIRLVSIADDFLRVDRIVYQNFHQYSTLPLTSMKLVRLTVCVWGWVRRCGLTRYKDIPVWLVSFVDPLFCCLNRF